MLLTLDHVFLAHQSGQNDENLADQAAKARQSLTISVQVGGCKKKLHLWY